jgi:hypothetical protein
LLKVLTKIRVCGATIWPGAGETLITFPASSGRDGARYSKKKI